MLGSCGWLLRDQDDAAATAEVLDREADDVIAVEDMAAFQLLQDFVDIAAEQAGLAPGFPAGVTGVEITRVFDANRATRTNTGFDLRR